MSKQRVITLALTAVVAALTLLAVPAFAGADDDEDEGRATPTFNFNATLHPPGGANADDDDDDEGGPSGLLKFRQPVDADVIVYLDVRVRRLAANSIFTVQRAVDTTVDDVCTGTNWDMPTLGQIATDRRGRGRANLERALPPALVGMTFDIHFRVIDAAGTVVLQSACHQYTARR